LGHHVEFPSEDAEGFAVDRVRVAGGVDLGPGFVDLGMDGEGGGVDLLGQQNTDSQSVPYPDKGWQYGGRFDK
jgi:hypothetical protein